MSGYSYKFMLNMKTLPIFCDFCKNVDHSITKFKKGKVTQEEHKDNGVHINKCVNNSNKELSNVDPNINNANISNEDGDPSCVNNKTN